MVSTEKKGKLLDKEKINQSIPSSPASASFQSTVSEEQEKQE
jgi:hypothetical protein